jgi:hypothetical protein
VFTVFSDMGFQYLRKGDRSIFLIENGVSARSGASFEHNIYLLMLRYQTSTHLKENP